MKTTNSAIDIFLDCKPDPCHGRGVCHNSHVGFSCTCQQGFTGVSCEIGKIMKNC